MVGRRFDDWMLMMPQSIVVFGGSGFIGTHLIRRLSAEGAASIVSVDLKPQRETLPGVDYRVADVRDLSSFVPPPNVQRIYNFAAVHTTPGHPTHEYYETNILGATEVTALAARNGIGEIVFTSSISVYGPAEETKTEATAPTPNSAYGYSKLLAERIHTRWLDAGEGRRLTIVRPAVVFGPGEGGNFTRLAALLRKGVFVYPGRRDTIKACIYVEDLVEAIEYARGLGERSVLFNGAYPDRYTLEQIVETFSRMYFPSVRTFMVPPQVVVGLAKVIGAVGFLGKDIHPERVLKLIRSTDVYPDWLLSQGQAKAGTLESALKRWSEASNGSFV
jgi:GlcNAc-P-P-Und epimerase